MLGFKDGKYGIASEDVAFRENGGKFFEELDPGTMYYLSQNGSYTKEPVVQPALAHCFFEWNYIADLESRVNRIDTRTVRENLGVILAEEFHPPDADLVTFLPRCPEVAAEWYAKTLKQYHPHLPLELFKPIFYKMKGERAFQGSTKEERHESINRNLFLLPSMKDHLINKRVILVDDSIIRGNNIERARSLLYDEARVKEAIFLSYTPPIGILGNDGVPRGCMFGVDMPPHDSFIAREKNLEEISKAVGMKVIYISQQGMLEAFRRSGFQNPEKNLCAYCIGGKHPFEQE
jgi:amidophosphoribosyltransferase